MSCQGDWLPPIYAEKLATLQDQAPAVDWQTIQQVLREELGEEWESRFTFIDPQPVATASIAQVHKAKMPYGAEVALKIQLPDAEECVRADLQFFQQMAKLLNRHIASIDVEQTVAELSKSIVQELDYYHEAANLTRFSTQYQAEEWIFPILQPELLTQKVLGMDFITGSSLRVFLAEVPSAAESLLRLLVQSFLKQIFITGLFHADPHPGNFFCNSSREIGTTGFRSDWLFGGCRMLELSEYLNRHDDASRKRF